MALNPYQLARASCAACLLGLLALPATAELLQPGDLKLRHDIQMLADGSYLGVALGNWFLSASATDRWWGPGRDGSMILSNNARPMPAITLQRREARPPGARWLCWAVPWTTQVIFGQMEHDRHVPDTQFFGWRVGFKPLPNLEIGLSRTAQWCGEGRPCDFSTFIDLLTGIRDNPDPSEEPSDEPGNQL
ncbi:MAG: capsule assembly Wzi family protein, partial [Gammaproteobacteria bacterium]